MPAVISNIGTTRQRNTFSIGLMIALSSWALIFFTMAWGYVVFRLRSTSWLQGYLTPQEEALAILNTIVMGLSSLYLNWAVKGRDTEIWAWLAFALGIVFLIGQLCLWQMILAQGLHWHSSMAGSFFFLLTGFHFLHIVGALIAVLVLCVRLEAWRGSTISMGIKYFWDFLFYVWMVLFALIFIIQ